MTRTGWTWLRLAGPIAVLGFLLYRVGTGPFLTGVRTIDPASLLAAAGITVFGTGCCAWRWRVIAGGLGLRLPIGTAIAAYYRSQFLNTTLPGGVLGDVHRGLRQGRDSGDLARGLRAVGWERAAGQAVQAVATVLVLLLLPSPVRQFMPAAALGAVTFVIAAAVLARGIADRRRGPAARLLRAAAADLRAGLLGRRAWPSIVLCSAAALAAQLAIFLIAARAVGVSATPAQLIPLGMLVLLAMSVPMNIAGWGPREGVAAWVFGAAGLGVSQGVAVAVAYGVLVFLSCLPGALVLGRRPQLAHSRGAADG